MNPPSRKDPVIMKSHIKQVTTLSSSKLFFQQQQQRPVSMYEASNLQSHSMQSHTFQSHMQTTNNTTNNNKTTIPMKYSLQPLGGRADLTVRPDMQDDSSSSPDSWT